ncbi:UDP-glucose 4-epimerase GalE [Oleidesulfovibrio sp.]|uniref:UDP-glucose 4-epimerase GalE n=1 Tax=Oleidesulfovibrio sp. TaxID=2909707 RepID=UPI003A85993D
MQPQKVLVCGGAGYIGSHMVRALIKAGHQPVVFDNLSTGHIDSIGDVDFIRGDLLDIQVVRRVFGEYCFDAVMHFSAKSLVGESVVDPAIYYTNNVTGTANLLEAMRECGVLKLVFSSTAAVYGNPVTETIREDHPRAPVNPYGRSKLMVEHMLGDYAAAYDMRSVSLRYFNAAGADEAGDIGEAHNPETHLIPNVLLAALEKNEGLKVFGDDYPTADGTCVRDYIHVTDLCSAHLAALEYLTLHNGAHAFNLGNGNGFSVRQVLDAAMRVTGKEIPYAVEGRRAGDPAILVADAGRAKTELGWQPEYTDVEKIIETAWRWHQEQRY